MYISCSLHNRGGDADRKSGGERGGDMQRDAAEPMRGGDFYGDFAVGSMLPETEGAEAVPLRLLERSKP